MTDTATIPTPPLSIQSWERRTSTVATLLSWTPRNPNPACPTHAPCGIRRVGHWRVDVYADGQRDIWHYSTRMLSVTAEGEIIHLSTGHGSVSDQGMMNKLFRALGSGLYFSRKGGAEIVGAGK